jgi:hypothetical protein
LLKSSNTPLFYFCFKRKLWGWGGWGEKNEMHINFYLIVLWRKNKEGKKWYASMGLVKSVLPSSGEKTIRSFQSFNYYSSLISLHQLFIYFSSFFPFHFLSIQTTYKICTYSLIFFPSIIFSQSTKIKFGNTEVSFLNFTHYVLMIHFLAIKWVELCEQMGWN